MGANASNGRQRSDVVHIPFHGDNLMAVEVDGKPHIILKPALESIGLDYSSQLQKLRGKSWASMGMSTIQLPGVQSQRREMVTCDVRTFLMLLATIDERRVAPEVSPKLIAYQAEVADVIEAYFTKGIAVNPRYTPKEQAEVLQTLVGVVDEGWLNAKGRGLACRVLGETPDYDPDTKPLTVSIYLDQRGLTGTETRQIAGDFGKRLKKKYREQFGTDPRQIEDMVNRHMVYVAQYQEQHRPLFDEVWMTMTREPNTNRPSGRGGSNKAPRSRRK